MESDLEGQGVVISVIFQTLFSGSAAGRPQHYIMPFGILAPESL